MPFFIFSSEKSKLYLLTRSSLILFGLLCFINVASSDSFVPVARSLIFRPEDRSVCFLDHCQSRAAMEPDIGSRLQRRRIRRLYRFLLLRLLPPPLSSLPSHALFLLTDLLQPYTVIVLDLRSRLQIEEKLRENEI